jgi:hypothetical protein
MPSSSTTSCSASGRLGRGISRDGAAPRFVAKKVAYHPARLGVEAGEAGLPSRRPGKVNPCVRRDALYDMLDAERVALTERGT